MTQVSNDNGVTMARVDPTLRIVNAHLQRNVFGIVVQDNLQMAFSPGVAGDIECG